MQVDEPAPRDLPPEEHFHIEIAAASEAQEPFLGDFDPIETSWIPENPVPVSTLEGYVEDAGKHIDELDADSNDLEKEQNIENIHLESHSIDKDTQIKTLMENGYRMKVVLSFASLIF